MLMQVAARGKRPGAYEQSIAVHNNMVEFLESGHHIILTFIGC